MIQIYQMKKADLIRWVQLEIRPSNINKKLMRKGTYTPSQQKETKYRHERNAVTCR